MVVAVYLGTLIRWLGSRLERTNPLSWSKIIFRRSCLSSQHTRKYCHEHTRHRKRPQYGSRYLTDPRLVYHFNNWDNVVWDESQELEAKRITTEHTENRVTVDIQEKHEVDANEYWNSFYELHQNRFFKDRHWLFTEFPELALNVKAWNSGICRHADADDLSCATGTTSEHVISESVNCSDSDSALENLPHKESDCLQKHSTDLHVPRKCHPHDAAESECFPGEHADFRILEVGCGVGNTVFPVLQTNNEPSLMVYCCDFSSTAIQIVKNHPDYDPRRCHPFVLDMTSDESPLPFPENSLDIVILIFVLSAINPEKMQFSVSRLSRYLKPGGIVLFRDYGRYDMAQLRFKKGRCLSENFYVRGDGTRVYFFTQDDLRELFTTAGLVEEQNLVDRRLQVNRGRQLKMYRVWIQCKYRKPWRPETTSDRDGVNCSVVTKDRSEKCQTGDDHEST